MLDAAAELFYARGVHEVGMDELIAATGLGKATVYRLFPTKDALIGAYLRRLADQILGAIDQQIARTATTRLPPSGRSSPPSARTWPAPASAAARSTTPASSSPTRPSGTGRRPRLPSRAAPAPQDLAAGARPDLGPRLGAQLAVLIDGMRTSAAHLGPHGPAATGLAPR